MADQAGENAASSSSQLDKMPVEKPALAPPVLFGQFSPTELVPFGPEVPIPRRVLVPSRHIPHVAPGDSLIFDRSTIPRPAAARQVTNPLDVADPSGSPGTLAGSDEQDFGSLFDEEAMARDNFDPVTMAALSKTGPSPTAAANTGKDLISSPAGDQVFALKAVEAERDSLRAEIQMLVSTHSQEVRDNTAKYESGMNGLEQQAEKATKSLNNMKKELDVQSRITTIQQREMEAKDLRIQNLETALTNGQKQSAGNDEELKRARNLLNKAYVNLKAERAENKRARVADQDYKTKLHDEKAARLNAEKTLEAVQHDYQALQSSNPHKLKDAAKEELEQVKDQFEKLSATKDGLAHQIKTLGSNIGALREDNTNLKQQVEELEEDLAAVFSESKKDQSLVKLQCEELEKYRRSGNVEESIRTSWRKAYGEKANPEGVQNEQEPSGNPDPTIDTKAASSAEPISGTEPTNSTSPTSRTSTTTATEPNSATEPRSTDEASQLLELDSAAVSPAFGPIDVGDDIASTEMSNLAGSGERLGIGPLTLPVATILKQRYQKQEQDLEMLLDISPMRAKAVLHTLRENQGYQHNHPMRLVVIASELLHIPREFVTSLHCSLEGVDHKNDPKYEVKQKIAAAYLMMTPKVLGAMLKREMHSMMTSRAWGTQTEITGMMMMQDTETGDMATVTRDTETDRMATVTQGTQTEDMATPTQHTDTGDMAMVTQGTKTKSMVPATQDTETDRMVTVTQDTHTEDMETMPERATPVGHGVNEEHPIPKEPQSNPLSLSGIQDLSVAPSIITIAPSLPNTDHFDTLSAISRHVDTFRSYSPHLVALYILVFLMFCTFMNWTIKMFFEKDAPILVMTEDLWTKSVMSFRAGGGCGFGVPEWMWEDPFLELSGSFFG